MVNKVRNDAEESAAEAKELQTKMKEAVDYFADNKLIPEEVRKELSQNKEADVVVNGEVDGGLALKGQFTSNAQNN